MTTLYDRVRSIEVDDQSYSLPPLVSDINTQDVELALTQMNRIKPFKRYHRYLAKGGTTLFMNELDSAIALENIHQKQSVWKSVTALNIYACRQIYQWTLETWSTYFPNLQRLCIRGLDLSQSVSSLPLVSDLSLIQMFSRDPYDYKLPVWPSTVTSLTLSWDESVHIHMTEQHPIHQIKTLVVPQPSDVDLFRFIALKSATVHNNRQVSDCKLDELAVTVFDERYFLPPYLKRFAFSEFRGNHMILPNTIETLEVDLASVIQVPWNTLVQLTNVVIHFAESTLDDLPISFQDLCQTPLPQLTSIKVINESCLNMNSLLHHLAESVFANQLVDLHVINRASMNQSKLVLDELKQLSRLRKLSWIGSGVPSAIPKTIRHFTTEYTDNTSYVPKTSSKNTVLHLLLPDPIFTIRLQGSYPVLELIWKDTQQASPVVITLSQSAQISSVITNQPVRPRFIDSTGSSQRMDWKYRPSAGGTINWDWDHVIDTNQAVVRLLKAELGPELQVSKKMNFPQQMNMQHDKKERLLGYKILGQLPSVTVSGVQTLHKLHRCAEVIVMDLAHTRFYKQQYDLVQRFQTLLMRQFPDEVSVLHISHSSMIVQTNPTTQSAVYGALLNLIIIHVLRSEEYVHVMHQGTTYRVDANTAREFWTRLYERDSSITLNVYAPMIKTKEEIRREKADQVAFEARVAHEKEKMQHRLTAIMIEKKNLKEIHSELEAQIKYVQDENQSLKEENESLKEENQTMKQENQLLRRKNDRLEFINDKLNTEMRFLSKRDDTVLANENRNAIMNKGKKAKSKGGRR